MKKLLLVVIAVLLLTGTAYAECWICDRVDTGEYASKAGGRLIRGLGNTLTGWAELFVSPGKEMEQGSHFFTAVVAALGNAIGRTGNGIVDLLTFWNPTTGKNIQDCPICGLGG